MVCGAADSHKFRYLQPVDTSANSTSADTNTTTPDNSTVNTPVDNSNDNSSATDGSNSSSSSNDTVTAPPPPEAAYDCFYCVYMGFVYDSIGCFNPVFFPGRATNTSDVITPAIDYNGCFSNGEEVQNNTQTFAIGDLTNSPLQVSVSCNYTG